MNASSSKLRRFLFATLIIISVITMIVAGEGRLLLGAFGTGLALGFAFTTNPIFGFAVLIALGNAGKEVRKAQAAHHVPVNANWLDIVGAVGMGVAGLASILPCFVLGLALGCGLAELSSGRGTQK